jgi:hypothetical protein
MNHATPIGPQGATPKLLLSNILVDVDDFSQLFVVAITKDDEVKVGISGFPAGMCLAGNVLIHHALHDARVDDITPGGSG